MELSEQCWHLQSSVSAKSCLNAKAEPFIPAQIGAAMTAPALVLIERKAVFCNGVCAFARQCYSMLALYGVLHPERFNTVARDHNGFYCAYMLCLGSGQLLSSCLHWRIFINLHAAASQQQLPFKLQ